MGTDRASGGAYNRATDSHDDLLTAVLRTVATPHFDRLRRGLHERTPLRGLDRIGHGFLGLVLACLLVPMPTMGETASDETFDTRAKDLQEIRRQVESLGQELTAQQSDRRALIEELEAREREVADAAVSGRELALAVAEQTRVAEALRVRHLEEYAALEQELAVWADLVRTAYVMGRADRLRLLLNQEDTAQASRILSYFAYLNREQLRRITAIQARVERLTRLAHDAEREAARLIELAQRQDAARLRLEAARQERADVLSRLEASIAGRTKDLEVLERDAEALRLLVEHLRQRAQIRAELEIQRDPFPARKGRLAWPLLHGDILAAFGSPKPDSELRWDGVLLATRQGEEVRAVHDGRVVHADWLRGFGLLIVIDHGEGYMSIYGHNEALLKETGEWVAGGEVIALSGDSGGRDEPVLYFAIRHNGKAQDPAAWCGGPGRPEPLSEAGRGNLYGLRERVGGESIKPHRRQPVGKVSCAEIDGLTSHQPVESNENMRC
jgi:septal ring factor EnvC (AmiA/AmiB activator)